MIQFEKSVAENYKNEPLRHNPLKSLCFIDLKSAKSLTQWLSFLH